MRRFLLNAGLVVAAAVIWAGPARALQPRDLYNLQKVGIGALSPDGRRLIYTRSSFDQVSDRANTTVILRDLDTGKDTVLFTPDDAATGFVWSPDGNVVVYTRPAAGATREVWLMDAAGGERRLLAPAGQYGPFVWAPDGHALAHVVPNTVGRYAGVPDAIIVADDLGYRHLDVGYREGTLKQLHVIDVATGEDTTIPTTALDVREVAWSPDASRLVFSAKRREDLGRDLNTDLFVVDSAGGAPRALTTNPGPDEHPAWIADGRIACQSHADPLHESEPGHIVVLDPDSGAEVARLVRDNADVMWGFTYHDGAFYYRGFRRGCIDIFRATATGGEALTHGGYDFWDVCYGGRRAVLRGGTMMQPGALQVLDLDSGDLKTLIDPNARWAERAGLVEPRDFVITVDDREIHGWVFLPPDRAPGTRVPTVLSIHGGPEWMYGGYFLPEFQVLATFGYAVIAANPTGSTGYGRVFQDGVRGDWNGRPAHELLACVDWAVAQGWADPQALAVMGGSYGGYLAAVLTTMTDRFKAAACDRMYPELTGFWGTTDEKWFPEWEFGGRPFDPQARVAYHANSPFANVERVTTPTLISGGADDYRCPLSGSETWFSALQSLGVPSRLLRFTGEGHGLRVRTNQVFYLEQVLGWFNEFVLGEGADE